MEPNTVSLNDVPGAVGALHDAQVDIFYRPEVSLREGAGRNFSKTPSKPQRFVEHVAAAALAPYVRIRSDFEALENADFERAHTAAYVEAFFAGREPYARSNGLAWSRAFAESVRYTSASLVHAVEGAIANPRRVTLSPTGGFHHARPSGGGGFCTFSGQVIAAVRAYERHGAVGAWVDLDGHFGNSIEDSREFAPVLNQAVPQAVHINPSGTGQRYLESLREGLDRVGEHVLSGAVTYVAFAHGADSHVWDQLSGQCSTAQWLCASQLVYSAIADWSRHLRRPVPVVLALFGGYRDDDPRSVLELHAADLAIALATLGGAPIEYTPVVTRP